MERNRDKGGQLNVMGWSLLPDTASECQSVANGRSHKPREATEMKSTTIGIDLAKNVFQVHGVD